MGKSAPGAPDVSKDGRWAFPLDPALPPMEARQADRLPTDPGWQYEPKWDGFRCLLFRAGNLAELAGKSGKSLARFFPEIVSLIERLHPGSFALDAELIVAPGGVPSFDALQMRLHPAESRIKRLSKETPATVILFDALGIDGRRLLDVPLIERREALEGFHKQNRDESLLKLSPFTRDAAVACAWLEASGGAIDGVVSKRLDGHYEPGKRSMIKVKRIRTADCVVGGFRYLEREHLVGSLLLGLYNERGELDHVGFTSAIAAHDRAQLTKHLESLIEPPGFTGKAPGRPSRWATEKSSAWEPLRPVLVVEVQYDHITANRFRHGTKLIRWRPDKSPRQCTFDQLPDPGSPFSEALFPS